MSIEPIEPSLDRDCTTCGPHRQGDVGEPSRDPVGIAGADRVVDRLLEEVVVLAPIRGAPTQFDDEIGVTSLQSVQERFSEQSVISEPFATPIHRQEKQIRRLERSEDLGRPHPFEDRIAQRPRHPIQDRGFLEEAHILG